VDFNAEAGVSPLLSFRNTSSLSYAYLGSGIGGGTILPNSHADLEWANFITQWAALGVSITPVASVPEPTTMLLLGSGLLGLIGFRRKLRR
jgi:hypothetical protein